MAWVNCSPERLVRWLSTCSQKVPSLRTWRHQAQMGMSPWSCCTWASVSSSEWTLSARSASTTSPVSPLDVSTIR